MQVHHPLPAVTDASDACATGVSVASGPVPRVSYSEVRGLLWFTPWFLEKVKNHNRFHWGDIHITPKKFMISKIRSFFIPKIQGFGFYTSPWQRKKTTSPWKLLDTNSSKWLKSWVRFRFNTATPAFGSMGRWSLWPPIAGCAKSCDLLIHFSKGITPPKKNVWTISIFFSTQKMRHRNVFRKLSWVETSTNFNHGTCISLSSCSRNSLWSCCSWHHNHQPGSKKSHMTSHPKMTFEVFVQHP